MAVVLCTTARGRAPLEWRRDAADRAGLGRVRVHDVGSPCAIEPAHVRTPCVSAVVELTLELREPDVRHAEVVGDALHRLLARRDRPGDHDHIVATRALAGGELEPYNSHAGK